MHAEVAATHCNANCAGDTGVATATALAKLVGFYGNPSTLRCAMNIHTHAYGIGYIVGYLAGVVSPAHLCHSIDRGKQLKRSVKVYVLHRFTIQGLTNFRRRHVGSLCTAVALDSKVIVQEGERDRERQ